MAKQVSVEYVDKQIAAYEKKNPPKAVKAFDLAGICAVVKKATPILQFVNGFLWWKPTWQKIIQQVIDAANSVCP